MGIATAGEAAAAVEDAGEGGAIKAGGGGNVALDDVVPGHELGEVADKGCGCWIGLGFGSGRLHKETFW